MRRFHRFIILATFLFANSAYALEFFLEGLDWRATETNDWAYVNSETLPHQKINYKTINFGYSPGFRIGVRYECYWDALFSYTRFFTKAHESTTGNIQPAFSGSVTAKPATSYLYQAGQVRQTIDYNILDLDFGKQFYPTEFLMLHPILGLMGGWINQSIHAKYQGTTSSDEKISNNFFGIGPKAGVDTRIRMFECYGFQPELIAVFATSYLVGHWKVNDVTNVTPTTETVYINGANRSMGAITLQGSVGIRVKYKNFAAKLLYEMNDWFNQSQFFDNDTGAHNNDLVLQGLTLGFSYDF